MEPGLYREVGFDVNISVKENIIKEVKEEAGLDVNTILLKQKI